MDLQVGDAVDFWRVEAVELGRRLRLAAEMKLPGRAWLEFEVTPTANGSIIRQTAIFDPVGLGGLAYWYALYRGAITARICRHASVEKMSAVSDRNWALQAWPPPAEARAAVSAWAGRPVAMVGDGTKPCGRSCPVARPCIPRPLTPAAAEGVKCRLR